MTRREIIELAKSIAGQMVANTIRAVRLVKNSSSGTTDETEGEQTFPGEPSYQRAVRRYQHFGFRSRPPAGVDVIRVMTNRSEGATVAEESSRFGPSDLADGETCIYNSVTGLKITLKTNGDMHIQVPSGQKVMIDDGSGASALIKKSDFDGHTHGPGSYTAGTTAVTGTSAGAAAASGTTVLQGK